MSDGGVEPGRPVMADVFRRFYEELMIMTNEGVSAATIVDKIRRAVPDRESRKQLLGHLRDSRDALEAEGRDEAAETLEQVIGTLENPDVA